MRQDEDATITETKAREARRRRDVDDLNNENAGREVGRMKRFLTGEADPDKKQKQREREHEFRSALMALLQDDPEYAVLYEETMDKLREAEAATEAALIQARANLGNAKSPKERADAQASYDALLKYQVDVLGHARDRLADEDNPPSKDELRDIQREIKEQAPAPIQSETGLGNQTQMASADATVSTSMPKL